MRHHIGDIDNCKREREELAYLLKEQEKRDILRRLPLYSSKITGYRWLCSSCYDKAYSSSRMKEGRRSKKEKKDLLTAEPDN
jgi:hypothetical protein